MVDNNEDPKMTAFTITVDAKRGISTGISAGDRARTLRALADLEVNTGVGSPSPVLVIRQCFACVCFP